MPRCGLAARDSGIGRAMQSRRIFRVSAEAETGCRQRKRIFRIFILEKIPAGLVLKNVSQVMCVKDVRSTDALVQILKQRFPLPPPSLTVDV